MQLLVKGEAAMGPMESAKDDAKYELTEEELAGVKELYYEWHKKDMTLKLFGKTDASLTIGTDTAVVDGNEVKLNEAVTMFDGLPVIPMSIYAKVIGYKLVQKDNICELVKS